MTENIQQSPFPETWALVELMGHTKVAGRITEEAHFGTPLMRCDIPTGPDSYFTQWYGGSAIFRITPIEEAAARAFTARSQPQPVQPYQLAALPFPRMEPTQDDDMDDDDWDDND
jgi:hypothetical protein